MGRTLPIAARLYLASTILVAGGFVILGIWLSDPNLTRSVLLTALTLGLVSLLLEFIEFPLLISGDTSFSTVTYMAMVFLLPFPLPPIVGMAVLLAANIRQRGSPLVLAFNTANFTLTLGISSLLWLILGRGNSLQELPLHPFSLLTIIVVVLAFYGVNVLLTNIIIAIVGKRSLRFIWLTNDLDFLMPYISLQVVGTLAALIWETAPVVLPLLVVPAVTTYIAFEMIHRLQNQTQEAMIAMADAIDQRDPYTADHSRRVSEMSVRIAELSGMNERDIEQLRLAGRLHDIGKIGIGNDLLHKPGKLTEEEWKLLRDHPVIGEQLLKPYRQFRHETQLVRSHHERWDGKGYPDGLRGKSIPLGARIIAVSDTYDAMTTSRPYRPALSRQIAIDEIRSGALTQFDPQIVAYFLQIMEQDEKIIPLDPGRNRDRDSGSEKDGTTGTSAGSTQGQVTNIATRTALSSTTNTVTTIANGATGTMPGSAVATNGANASSGDGPTSASTVMGVGTGTGAGAGTGPIAGVSKATSAAPASGVGGGVSASGESGTMSAMNITQLPRSANGSGATLPPPPTPITSTRQPLS